MALASTNRFGFLSKTVKLPDDWDVWPNKEARALGIID